MKKSLSLASANILYLVSMLLVLLVGGVIQMLSLTWGLIGTEIFLIALPAVLLLKARHIPLREGLRLRPVSWVVAVLALLLGISTFLFSIYMEGVMMQISGTVPVALPEGSTPQTMLDSVLYFIALAIAAPICEEILFRGAIQGAYKTHRKPWFAILITALMFAFYHFRLTGLPALIPVAIILCYVTWRTQSIFPAMLVHFGMNASSAANSLVALNFNHTGLFSLTSPWQALAGVVLAAVLIYLLNRLVPAPQPEPAPAAEPVVANSFTQWLANYWSLGVAGVLYLVIAGLTLMVTLFPEMTAQTTATYSPPEITAAQESHYQITNRAGVVVGQAACTVTPHGPTFDLVCERTVEGYEVQTGSSFFADASHTAAWKAVWDGQTLDLIDYSFEKKLADGGGYSVALNEGNLVVTHSDGVDVLELLPSTLLEYEWPWRVNQLNGQGGGAYKLPIAYLIQWDEELQRAVPTERSELLRIYPLDSLDLPAGHFDTSKVTFAGQTAWYASGSGGAPRPVQFDDGMLTYSLVK